jgi:hypothetical protein
MWCCGPRADAVGPLGSWEESGFYSKYHEKPLKGLNYEENSGP